MKKKLLIVALVVSSLASAPLASAQTPAAAPQSSSADRDITANGVIGEVVVVNPDAKGLAVKTTAGNSVLVMLTDKTALKRAQPGSTTLTGATDITLADIGVGDKIYARGRVAADQKTVPAQLVVVMTKADIAKKQEHDRTEWQRRGVWGTITALDAATKTVTVSARTPEGMKPITVDASGAKIDFRRYAPDSVKFSDAKASTFADLKVGDQLRALGERSADGAKFTPEEIVSGSFKTILGTITSIDAATNQIKITPSDKKQPLIVVVSSNTNLRKLDPQAGQMLGFVALRAAGGGMPGGGGFGRPGGGQGGGQPPAGGAGGQGGGGFRRAGGGGAGGGFDLQDMVDRQPQATLADLKPGDVVIVSSTTGTDPTRVNAITLLAGAEPVLAALQAQPRRGGASGGADLGLPAGIDLGIGLP